MLLGPGDEIGKLVIRLFLLKGLSTFFLLLKLVTLEGERNILLLDLLEVLDLSRDTDAYCCSCFDEEEASLKGDYERGQVCLVGLFFLPELRGSKLMDEGLLKSFCIPRDDRIGSLFVFSFELNEIC